MSSYDVIRKLKIKYPGEKIGHGGTLDPLAEGVLVVGIGKEDTKRLHEILKSFIGEIDQIPPRYSAVKINGTPAYKRARRGEQFTLAPKQVTIDALELIDYHYPMLKIRVKTGAGVYIRSLARDIGESLSTGGYITQLVRTTVGSYSIDSCSDIDTYSD